MRLGTPALDLDALVCDLDGVVYRGSRVIEGAPAALAAIRSKGIKIVFATNNATHTVDSYCRRLTELGIPATRDDIVTSAVVTVEEVSRRGWTGESVLLVGGDGLRDASERAGLRLVEGREGRRAGVVIVSGTPHLTYDHIRDAAFAVRDGAHLIATNADPTFPAPDGLWPGAGAVLAAIEVASGRKAEVLGKPNLPMMQAIGRRLTGRRRIAAVGDQPGTDLAGARAMGWSTILVLSGVTGTQAASDLQEPPDLVAADIVEAERALTGPAGPSGIDQQQPKV